MAGTRYPQFCGLARAAEVVGERWTLLIVRELLATPRRFADLRERLQGLSPSVLAERLARLETAGLIARRHLEAPAAITVYELTAAGRGLEPALLALARWGAQRLLSPRSRERLDGEWLRLALRACARPAASPAVALQFRVRAHRTDVLLRIEGGPHGTQITDALGPTAVTVSADPATVIALATGRLAPSAARRDRTIRIEGDPTALDHLPALFHFPDELPHSPDRHDRSAESRSNTT